MDCFLFSWFMSKHNTGNNKSAKDAPPSLSLSLSLAWETFQQHEFAGRTHLYPF